MNKVLGIAIIFSIMLVGCTNEDDEPVSNDQDQEQETEEITSKPVEESEEQVEELEQEEVELSPKDEMLIKVVDLIDEGLAFDTGSYIKGDIPKGEYAFITFDGSGEYYSEEDASGSIIDNENFSSFGYVQVHEAGNIETRGILVKFEVLEELEVSGAKELYELLNETESYFESGMYKAGVDIEPGEYVLESYGSGYVAVTSGPIGNGDIVKNDNFDGRYSINVQDGQYLNISSATFDE